MGPVLYSEMLLIVNTSSNLVLYCTIGESGKKKARITPLSPILYEKLDSVSDIMIFVVMLQVL